jgi:pSer/pThr/pTyr-binding forkhead associated (FHA) protein
MTAHDTPETISETTGAAVARIAVAAGGVLFLRPGRYVLGRGSDCDLVLTDRGVSRRHAAVEVGETGAVILDLGSSNGTLVNGLSGPCLLLHHGAVVRLGPATCVFECLDRAGDVDEPTAPNDDPPGGEPRLTAAERRVLTHLLGGSAEKEIATHLGLSRHTVHNHVKRIYSAYGVSTRPELLAHFIPSAGRPQPAAGRRHMT